MRKLILGITLAASPWAQAERPVEYSEKLVTFDEWTAKAPKEAAVLGLFRGYKEPVVSYMEDGARKTAVAKLTIYVTRIKTEVQKPAGQIDLKRFLDLNALAQLDSEITHKSVGPGELMPAIGGRGPVPNFKWCNKNDGKVYIALPDFEQNLDYLKGDHAWCSEQGRSVCIESCYLFGDAWQAGVTGVNLVKKLVSSNPADLKDYGIGMQSEVRIFNSENEYGQKVSNLTGLSTPVRGIVEINMFYINQVMQYGKIVAVFQDHPNDPARTVVTSLNAIGVRTKSLKKHGILKEILQGQSDLNTQTGITAGIPVFTKNIAGSMANILEK